MRTQYDRDREYMEQALMLAKKGLYTCHPNPRVGCVIIKNNQIIGEGYHQYFGQQHAETMALEQASGNAQDSTVYVTLEPCAHHGKTPPCVDALIQSGIAKIFIAIKDPFSQVTGEAIEELKKHGIQVDIGLLEQEAYELNRGFFHRINHGKPWVRLKMAVSLDGKTAMASGESQWITGAAARQDVQHWRAQSGAIMTGVNTVIADDPKLTVREFGSICSQPLRVILDSNFKTPISSLILKQPGHTLIIGSEQPTAMLTQLDQVIVKRVDRNKLGLNLETVLQTLSELPINDVLVECGPQLAGSLIKANCVNELIVYMAPSLLGSDAKGMLYLPGLEKLVDRINLTLIDYQLFDQDLRLRYYVN